MIDVNNKYMCCGCSACAQVCPKACIKMKSDEEGFLYPQFERDKCIECGLCEHVCPIVHTPDARLPISSFAAKCNRLDVQLNSSSGGVFTEIAERIIGQGGIVYGALFSDHFVLKHAAVGNSNNLTNLRGSKYVQSAISDSYRETKEHLQEGRTVLFSGTPCQIAGLKNYLVKDYPSLITVAVACHGVPSPKTFEDYLNFVTNNNIVRISKIFFRDKSEDWIHYKIKILSKSGELILDENAYSNMYMQSFFKNYNLRPSCYKCAFKPWQSGADIMLADFWGIWNCSPDYYDSKGVSAVLAFSEKGLDIIDELSIDKRTIDYSSVISENSSIVHSSKEPEDRQKFWTKWLNKDFKAVKALCVPSKRGLFHRFIDFIFK